MSTENSTPAVLVMVSGGVATIYAKPNTVRAALLDYDNDPDISLLDLPNEFTNLVEINPLCE